MSRRRPRGLSLAELLVVMFLSGVVFFLMMQLLMPSVMLFRLESAATDAQQTAFIVVTRMSKDLMNSQLQTMTFLYDPNDDLGSAVSFQTVDPSNPFGDQGRPRFQSDFKVYYWKRSEQRLWSARTQDQPSGHDWTNPQSPQRMTVDELRTFCNGSDGTRRVVGRNLETFWLTDNDFDLSLLHPPLRLEVTTKVEAPRGLNRTYETYTMKTQFTPRLVQY